MKFPSRYLALKPILDRSLFDVQDADDHFATNQTISFSPEFLSYQKRFLKHETHVDHELLLKTCYQHLSQVSKGIRKEIVEVIVENQPLSEALIMTTMLTDGSADPELGSIKYLLGLRIYIEDKSVNDSMVLFFQQHFLNYERIEPSNYKDFELNRAEYLRLVSDYLQIQSQIY